MHSDGVPVVVVLTAEGSEEEEDVVQGMMRVMEWVQGCQVEMWKLHMS